MTSKKIVLFELNEVPWRVLDDYVASHPQSAAARLLAKSHSFTTVAEDTSLSPWVTWPSLHRGVTDEQHAITDFGQDLSEVNAAYPALWELLARSGVRTGVCGSLHSFPLPSRLDGYDFYLPDPFASDSRCFPAELEAFQRLSLAMSRESARNVSTRIPVKDAARFLARAPRLGITPRTALSTAKQLVDERRKSWTKVRRRTYQSVLAFDLFMRALETTRPTFSTFFTNHVASTMHRYWAAKYPGHYDAFDFSSEWVETYSGEIDWTMDRFDEMLRRLLAFVEKQADYELWVTGSMGQAATSATVAQTQVYLEDVPRFMRALGFEDGTWETRPAMLPRVIIALKSAEDARKFETKLAGIQIADRGALPWKRLEGGVYRIHPGVLQNVTSEACVLEGSATSMEKLGFRNVVLQDSVGQSAYHIRNGALLVYSPTTKGQRVASEVSTLDVAPSMLRRIGVKQPGYMRTGFDLPS